VDNWEANNITGYKKYPAPVIQATGSKIKQRTPPPYYHIQVTGRCELDLEAIGIRIVTLCPKCGYGREEFLVDDPHRDQENPFGFFPFVIKEETWDGSDLFVSELFDRHIFCSQKVFDLAGLNRRTNFRFTLPEDSGIDDNRDIDYIKAARRKFGAQAIRPLEEKEDTETLPSQNDSQHVLPFEEQSPGKSPKEN
jgi:hypothetical protein